MPLISEEEKDYYLSFIFKCKSLESESIIETLSDSINPCRGRRKKPSPQFFMALEVMVAALLWQAKIIPGSYLYRSMTTESFEDDGMRDEPFGYRPFKSVVDGLKEQGYLEVVKGFKDNMAPASAKGRATQFRCTNKLIALAEGHGIRVPDWSSHFEMLPRPKVVKKPIECRADSRTTRKGKKIKGGSMPVDRSDPKVSRYAQQVHDINAFMAGQDIQPPEWHFAFTRIFAQGDHPDFNWNKGARLYSHGFGQSYQQVEKAERKRMTINGERVVEVDIRASYLTILHHRMGVPLPAGDPYDIPGVPRSVVKIWVTITLGNDKFHRWWPAKAKAKYADCDEFDGRCLDKAYPFVTTQAKILKHIPLLKDWPKIPVRWGELQFLESEAVVEAVHKLVTQWGIPALPLHDALIVPKSKARIAEQILANSFHRHVGARPFIAIKDRNEGLI